VWTDDIPATARRSGDVSALRTSPTLVLDPRRDRPVGVLRDLGTARRSVTEWEISLVQGISDLAGIFLENAQLYREAADANRAKDEFLATLSHELRNPLGAIVNAVAALTTGVGEDRAERLRQIIHRQTHHLTRLVDDLLDVAQATTGKIALTPSRRPGGCRRRLRPPLRESGRADGRQVTFCVESVIVNADPTRLAQIITNLLDNAVKFTQRRLGRRRCPARRAGGRDSRER
jgi:signal transduction histidine kinase